MRAAPKPVSTQAKASEAEFLCDREVAWDREKAVAGEDVFTVSDVGQAGDGFHD